MRLTPLTSEVRRSSFRVAKEGEQKRQWTRWVVLAAVYVVTVALTSPFYFYRPPVPTSSEQLVDLPVRAQANFRFVSTEAREEYDRERRRFHKRIYVYDTDVRARVLADLEGIFAASDALNPDTDDPSQIIAVLRREDSRLSFLDEQRAPDFVRVVRDPRFRQALYAIVNDAYSGSVIVEQPTMYEGFREDRVVEIVDETNSLANRRDVLDNPLPFPPDWFTWNPLLQRLNDAYGMGAPDDARRVAELLLTAVLQPNLRFDEAATREAFDAYPPRDMSTLYRTGMTLLTRDQLVDGLGPDDVRLLREHRQAVVNRHNVRLAGHAAFVLIVFFILSFYVRRFSRQFAFNTYNLMLVSLPVLIALAVEAFIIFLASGDSSRVGYLFPAGAIGLLGVLLLDVRMALLLVTWGCLLLGLQADLHYEFVVVGIFGGYTGVAAISNIRKRWEVFLASISIGFVNAAVILITSIILNVGHLPLDLAGMGFFSGVASFLVLAILPLF
jgi:membrane-associated HD superfamily phosphohydrolase